MNEKVFRFHGLDFKRVIIGVSLLGIVTLIGFFVPIVFFDSDTPTLSAITAGLCAVLTITVGVKFLKQLWTVKFVDERMEVYFGSHLKGRFALSDLEKIHIRGWNHKKSYFLLRLTTGRDRLSIFIDGSDTTKFTSFQEMKIFDELVGALESYALRNEYIKKNLKKSLTHADFRNDYYLQKQNV